MNDPTKALRLWVEARRWVANDSVLWTVAPGARSTLDMTMGQLRQIVAELTDLCSTDPTNVDAALDATHAPAWSQDKVDRILKKAGVTAPDDEALAKALRLAGHAANAANGPPWEQLTVMATRYWLAVAREARRLLAQPGGGHE